MGCSRLPETCEIKITILAFLHAGRDDSYFLPFATVCTFPCARSTAAHPSLGCFQSSPPSPAPQTPVEAILLCVCRCNSVSCFSTLDLLLCLFMSTTPKPLTSLITSSFLLTPSQPTGPPYHHNTIGGSCNARLAQTDHALPHIEPGGGPQLPSPSEFI